MPTDMRITSFALPDDLLDGLRRLRALHGTPASEVIRRALRAYLEQQKVLHPAKIRTPRRGGRG
jgi:Arc/MetJ-type ribon-helix-helix transcriptional regulator